MKFINFIKTNANTILIIITTILLTLFIIYYWDSINEVMQYIISIIKPIFNEIFRFIYWIIASIVALIILFLYNIKKVVKKMEDILKHYLLCCINNLTSKFRLPSKQLPSTKQLPLIKDGRHESSKMLLKPYISTFLRIILGLSILGVITAIIIISSGSGAEASIITFLEFAILGIIVSVVYLILAVIINEIPITKKIVEFIIIILDYLWKLIKIVLNFILKMLILIFSEPIVLAAALLTLLLFLISIIQSSSSFNPYILLFILYIFVSIINLFSNELEWKYTTAVTKYIAIPILFLSYYGLSKNISWSCVTILGMYYLMDAVLDKDNSPTLMGWLSYLVANIIILTLTGPYFIRDISSDGWIVLGISLGFYGLSLLFLNTIRKYWTKITVVASRFILYTTAASAIIHIVNKENINGIGTITVAAIFLILYDFCRALSTKDTNAAYFLGRLFYIVGLIFLVLWFLILSGALQFNFFMF